MTRTKIAAGAVLVVGTGYVGHQFMLRQTPGSAAGLSRSSISSSHPIEKFDLDKDEALPLLLSDRYSVLYTVPPPSASASDDRLERLLATLTTAPERFVYLSTTGVYGNQDGESVNEETPTNPGSDRAKRRVVAEQLLRAWCTNNASELVILRVPGIYGPRRLGIERIRQRAPLIAEQDLGPGNRIHVDDLVSCCEAVLSNDAPAGIYNIGDGDHRSSTWFAHEVARQCDFSPPPTISMAKAAHEFSATRMSFLTEARLVDTSKMRDVLGVTPRYTNAEEGISASLTEKLS